MPGFFQRPGITISEAVAVSQETHYYPFGLRLKGGAWQQSGASRNKYLYNGKELEGEDLGLNWFDYGARRYDPQLGKWHSVDPVDEFHSPYTYVGNNPANYTDPFGLDTYHFDADWNTIGIDETPWWMFWEWGDNYTFNGNYMGELAVFEADRWVNPSVIKPAIFTWITHAGLNMAIVPPSSDAIEANPFLDLGLLGAGAMLGVKAAAKSSSRILNTTAKQLQKKFKHAADFGVTGNFSKANAAKFNSAINQHLNSSGVKAIQGT